MSKIGLYVLIPSKDLTQCLIYSLSCNKRHYTKVKLTKQREVKLRENCSFCFCAFVINGL